MPPRKITTNNVQNNTDDTVEQTVSRKKTGRRPKAESQVNLETREIKETKETKHTEQDNSDNPDIHHQEKNNEIGRAHV